MYDNIQRIAGRFGSSPERGWENEQKFIENFATHCINFIISVLVQNRSKL